MDDSLEELVELTEDAPAPDFSIAAAINQTDFNILRSFRNARFPILLLDSELRIFYANDACNNLLTPYYRLIGERVSDVFGRTLGVTALRELLSSVRASERGFSWKGLIRSKAKVAGTILTKAYLYPIYARDTVAEKPPAFVIMFDDVTEENRALLRSVFLSLLEASKLKDNDTGKHIHRVNLYSERLALALFDKPGYTEIDRDFIDDIAFLAAMHDVGKIGTPDDILNKEGPLTDWEWGIMQEHTKNGAYILSTYPNPMAREIALYHHERWDGKGYPYNLEGTMIPLTARIVTIADVYDALRMKRSYKNAFDHRTAVDKIVEWSGTHFDPALVEVFTLLEADFEATYTENEDSETGQIG